MPTVNEKKWAVRFTGKAGINCGPLDTNALSQGFTIEAWVGPGKIDTGVVAHTGPGLQGNGVAFKAGRYDDLSPFHTGPGKIESLRVPPGCNAILFDRQGCLGNSVNLNTDSGNLGPAWKNRVNSLLDQQKQLEEQVVVYAQNGRRGLAQTYNLGMYLDLTNQTVAAQSIHSMLILRSLEVTLYAKPGCVGESRTFHGNVDELDEKWAGKAQSMMVTRAPSTVNAEASAKIQRASQAIVFGNEAGSGLFLALSSTFKRRPPTEHFAGKKLSTDRWSHLAITFDGQKLSSFINGHQVQQQDTSAPDLSGDWQIGKGLVGAVGLVVVHDKSLEQTALREGRYNIPDANGSNIVAAWTLEDGQPNQASQGEAPPTTDMAQQQPRVASTPKPGWSKANGGLLMHTWKGTAQESIETSDKAAAIPISQPTPAVELRSQRKCDLPKGDAFWAHAKLPASPLSTSSGSQIVLHAKQQKTRLSE